MTLNTFQKKTLKNFALVALFVFMGCKPEIEKELSVAFFDFDEVYHYQISEKEERNIYNTYNENDSIRIQFSMVVNGDSLPSSLNDNWFMQKLEKFYLKKQQLKGDKIDSLSTIFSSSLKEKSVSTTCEPIYRNVFIFKKQGKVVGISKICFDCLMEHTIGTKVSTRNFGSKNEYERLKKLVN